MDAVRRIWFARGVRPSPRLVSVLLVAACGARAPLDEGTCPPGYTCTKTCSNDCDAGNAGEDATVHDAATDRGADGLVDSSLADGGADVDAQADADADADTTDPPPPPPPAVTAGTVVLDHNVVDADLSTALWSIVMASTSPTNALYVYDVGTKQERSVALPATPVAVSVDHVGKTAAVAYDAHVSWIDLVTGTVTTTCSLSSNAYDVALSRSHVAYVVPRTDQWVSLHAVDLTTCTETIGSQLYAGQHIVMHPSQGAVFTADQGLSPSRVHRCDLSPIHCVDAQNNNDWGTYAYCGNLWASSDGRRLYTACGVVLSLPSPVDAGVATYGGTLGEPYVEHASDAPAAGDGGLIALLPGLGYPWDSTYDASADTHVDVHEALYLGLVEQVPLPALSDDAGTQAAHGRFVFTTPDMKALFVVVQNGAADAGSTFAIETLLP
jgi:chitinase